MSVAARFCLVACGLLVLFGFVAIGLAFGSAKQSKRHYFEQIGEETARNLADGARLALASGDLASAETMVDALAARADATVVMVRTEQAEVLRLKAPGLAPAVAGLAARAGRTEGVVSQQQGDLVLTAIAFAAPTGPGVVVYGFQRSPLTEGPRGLIVPIILLLLAMVAVAIPMVIVATRSALSPLRSLTAFAEKVDESNLSERIEIESGDEFERMGRALNRMVDRLQSALDRMQHMAFIDSVTELPNQEKLARDLTELVTKGKAEGGTLFVIHLDRLARVAETVGREAGDELRRQVAGKITNAARAIDRLVRGPQGAAKPSQVAALRSGDFAVYTPDLPSPHEIGRFSQMLASALNQAFEWREHRLTLGASVGAAAFDGKEDGAEAILRNAYLALTAARADSSRVRTYTKALDREAIAQLAFERDMRAAIEQNEFKAYFQPKIDLISGKVVGAEALARWIRPDKSIVSPARFIPAAEENGLIGPLSDVILRDACWKAANWVRDGHDLFVAINVSPRQFADDRFAEKILRTLEKANLSPRHIELEITESVALENPERAVRMLEPLRAEGMKVALDDFGCGHSNLGALTRLTFDVIKIDQQFVRGLGKDHHAPAIIEMILAMAASLAYDVVAEGVETEQQAEFLRRRGCGIGQGFLYGPGMQVQDFLKFASESPAARKGLRSVG